MQLQECLAEASREGGSGLGDAALGTGELGGEAAQEVVLGLLGSEDRYGRKHTECVSAQEDYILGSGTGRDRLYDAFDMVDRIRYAGVFSHALVLEVDFAFSVNGNVFQEGVTTDSVVDIGFALLIEVDNLSVATTFEVEHAVVIPTVFVVADEQTFRVSREGSLTGTGQAEEDSGVFAFLVGVGRAVHRSDTCLGKVVVHH